MRFTLGLALGLGAAAMASAAPARPGGTGQGAGGLAVGWSSGGGHHPGRVAEGWGYGPNRARPRDGRNHRRSGRQDFRFYGGGGGIVGPVGEVDRYGNGFFSGGGGRIRLRGGRPVFDYDRAYPYEWASAGGGAGADRAEAAPAAEPRPRCTYENGVRVCRGW